MHIRDASPDDLPAITAIYNDAVEHTTAIWNETVVDVDDRAAWLSDRNQRGYPVLVAVDGDRVLGYATFDDWRSHSGYRHTVEHSVYVHAEARGAGIGNTLMTELMSRARAAGKHVMVAAVEAGNAASVTLHERLGFTQTGLLPEVGTKFGRWLDLALLQLILDAHAPPHPPREKGREER